MTLNTRTTHTPKNSLMDCDGVLLPNIQFHMVPISISWLREYRTIEMKFTLGTRQETITVSNHPIHQNGHTNFWYVCLLERANFNYSVCSYNVWYVYNNRSTRAWTKVVRREQIVQPTSIGAYFSACFQWDGEDVQAPLELLKLLSSCCSPRKPSCNQFIYQHISSRRIFGINHFKLRNFAVIAIKYS